MSRNTPTAETSDRWAAALALPRRAVRWLAGLGFWAIFGGFGGLGVLATLTDRFASIAWVFFLLAGVLPIVLRTVESDAEEGHGYQYEMGNRERVQYVVSALAWSVTPWGILTQILQLGGQLVAMVRYRRRYPSHERHVPDTDLSLPFDGEWTAVNGGITEDTSHSWEFVAQRYAYDFVVTDEEGDSHAGDGTRLEDYYAFGEPIRAPAAGTVVKTKDRLRDYPRPGSGWLEWRTWDIRGNHVVVEHDDGEYSLLAHLEEGSVTVSPGDRVERGDVVGACGNSGHSGEPHLHYQIQDRPNFWITASLVPQFDGVDVTRDGDGRAERDAYRTADGDVEHLWAGDRVANADRR